MEVFAETEEEEEGKKCKVRYGALGGGTIIL